MGLRKSEKMGIADTLSQIHLSAEEEEEEETCCPRVLNTENEGPTLSSAKAETATRRDPVLGRVLHYVRTGLTETLDSALNVYQKKKDELSTEGDCLIWGGRLIVPTKLRKMALMEVHTGHVGGNKMKQLARRYVWWPGLDSDLLSLRGEESGTAKVNSASGTMILIVADSFFKWIEAVTMKTITAARTVEELRNLFAGHGRPLQIVSDNEAQFTSEEFATFTKRNDISLREPERQPTVARQPLMGRLPSENLDVGRQSHVSR
ncbi:uncharacterized protein K02A2.6-like [Pollicipes pollicipes]|uniref:uncharacterized protein K02A2.6-like n=1 Tax=Pollicipes pollicipes TaxID=41117 RepID=UPI0018849379|nr:uncharacterized protein K02A2.6-like [Pollicipes pollicipes]